MFKIIAALIVILLLAPAVITVFAVEDRRFEDEMRAGLTEAKGILVEHGLCPSVELCPNKQIIFFSAMAAGFERPGFGINIYGIKDQKLIAQIAQVFVEKFYRTPNMQHLFVHAYAFPIEEGDPIIKRLINGPIFNVDMTRSK